MLEEKKLIDGCRKGKKKYQKALYEQYSRKMFVVCLRYAKARLEAEDILQESFIKVFANIASFRGECPLEQWIKRIVVNTALKNNRSKLYLYPAHDVEALSNYLPAPEITISDYSFQELLALIQKLPERCQIVFNLYAIEGYKHQEIAKMLEISEGTSKSQYARAKTLLQEMIKQNEEESYEQLRRG